VRINFCGGNTPEGRVVKIEPGELYVHRDDNGSVIRISPGEVMNLSVGTVGRLEKLQWLKKQEMEELWSKIKLLS
jgi:uncharacterized cupin superfamily protein